MELYEVYEFDVSTSRLIYSQIATLEQWKARIEKEYKGWYILYKNAVFKDSLGIAKNIDRVECWGKLGGVFENEYIGMYDNTDNSSSIYLK